MLSCADHIADVDQAAEGGQPGRLSVLRQFFCLTRIESSSNHQLRVNVHVRAFFATTHSAVTFCGLDNLNMAAIAGFE